MFNSVLKYIGKKEEGRGKEEEGREEKNFINKGEKIRR